MEDIDHKERCELLRSYFSKLNPNSIPCTYKSNFEASAIQTLKGCELNSKDKDKEVGIYREFSPWRFCTPTKSSEKLPIKTQHNETKKTPRGNPTNLNRKNNFIRSMSDGNTTSIRSKTAKYVKLTKNSGDDSVKSTVPIPFTFQYNQDHKQYIEDYRRSYTQWKLQEANQARPVAARLRLRTYDFRAYAMRGLNKNITTPPNVSNGRAISLKTITLQVPEADNEFSCPYSSFLWPKTPTPKSTSDKLRERMKRR